MTDKEVIMIDGKDCTNCAKLSHCNNNNLICRSRYYAVKEELQRKEQKIEKIEEVIAPYQEDFELDALSLPTAIESILERLQAENEELKEELQTSKDDHAYAVELEKDVDRYKQALEKIENICKDHTRNYDQWKLSDLLCKKINEVLQNE